MTIYEPPWPTKTCQNPSQIHPKIFKKTMSKNACVFKTILYRVFSIFDFKVDDFLNAFCMQFSSKCQKCETSKISISLRKNRYFQGFEHSNRHQKSAKNPSKIRVRKNILKNAKKIDFGTHFGLQNPSKMKKNRTKIDVKNNIRKKCKKSGNMTPKKNRS